MSQLRFFDENNTLRTRNLSAEKFIIGRIESCQLMIVDDLVSREHSRVDRDPDGRYRIRDLGSRNKTYVNGQQINETLLNHGDMVRIGGRVFEFLADGQVEDLPDLSFLTPDRQDPPGTEWIKVKAPVTLPLSRLGEIGVLGADAGYPSRAEDVASAALGRLLLMLKADRGFVALRGESNKELRLVAHRGLSASPGGALTPVSRTFAYSAMLQSVAGRYPQKANQMDAKAGFAAAGLVAPLIYRNDMVGVVYIDKTGAGQVFPESALPEIAAAGAHIGALMADASQRLVDSEHKIGPAWLATLRRMQLSMTVTPQSSKAFDVSVKLIAGRARCGDFCDVIHVGEDRVFVLMIDAGGHGVAGLAQAAGVRTAVRAMLAVEGVIRDLAAIFSSINQTMVAPNARQLVTCTLVDIDPAGGEVRYINAGGPPPLLLVGAGRLVSLDQPALVLGIDSNYAYEASSVDLPASFRLVCHTDGLPEMANAAGEAYGSQHLHDLLLEREAFAAPQEVISRIVKDTERHRGGAASDDDATICVVSHG